MDHQPIVVAGKRLMNKKKTHSRNLSQNVAPRSPSWSWGFFCLISV